MATDNEGIIYTDLSGKFPVTSLSGNKYVLLLYHYDSNAILVKPLKNRSDKETLKAYDELYTKLTNSGLAPKLHVLDNEASTALKRQINKSKHEPIIPKCSPTKHAKPTTSKPKSKPTKPEATKSISTSTKLISTTTLSATTTSVPTNQQATKSVFFHQIHPLK